MPFSNTSQTLPPPTHVVMLIANDGTGRIELVEPSGSTSKTSQMQVLRESHCTLVREFFKSNKHPNELALAILGQFWANHPFAASMPLQRNEVMGSFKDTMTFCFTECWRGDGGRMLHAFVAAVNFVLGCSSDKDQDVFDARVLQGTLAIA
ncbi:hypothetical protein HDU98_004369 [Podochytrium sp. JEL0797]|nr:hypothetical protein HDU98_004369 [Podochytrium sp. JEL0797]